VKDRERGSAPGDQQEMIKNILFPVDFSPSCAAMAAYVQRAVAIFGGTGWESASVTRENRCAVSKQERVTMVFPRQGKFANDPEVLAAYPRADVTVERIGDLLSYEVSNLCRLTSAGSFS